MGIYDYLISPKLKKIFLLTKSYSEDTQDMFDTYMKRYLDRFENENLTDTSNWTLENFNKQRITSVLEVVSFYDDLAWFFGEDINSYMFIFSIRKYDPSVFIAREGSEELEELDKEYELIQW